MFESVVNHRSTKPHVHAIMGPTGAGKTARAMERARGLGAPIVVADRIQCFVDLVTTSARSAADDTPGIPRHFLGNRTVADGDYPVTAASRTLYDTLGSLALDHSSIVIEGGSISVLCALIDRHDALPFDLTFELLPIANPSSYWQRLLARARQMIAPARGETGILRELAAAWKHKEQRNFVASVVGLEAILQWCEQNNKDPESLAEYNPPEETLDDLATAIAYAHATHGRKQERIFSTALGKT